MAWLTTWSITSGAMLCGGPPCYRLSGRRHASDVLHDPWDEHVHAGRR